MGAMNEPLTPAAHRAKHPARQLACGHDTWGRSGPDDLVGEGTIIMPAIPDQFGGPGIPEKGWCWVGPEGWVDTEDVNLAPLSYWRGMSDETLVEARDEYRAKGLLGVADDIDDDLARRAASR
jgi:hypothetical protein